MTENGKPCTSIHHDGHTYCALRSGHVAGHFGGGKCWWDERVAPATVTPTWREAELERQLADVLVERDKLREAMEEVATYGPGCSRQGCCCMSTMDIATNALSVTKAKP